MPDTQIFGLGAHCVREGKASAGVAGTILEQSKGKLRVFCVIMITNARGCESVCVYDAKLSARKKQFDFNTRKYCTQICALVIFNIVCTLSLSLWRLIFTTCEEFISFCFTRSSGPFVRFHSAKASFTHLLFLQSHCE